MSQKKGLHLLLEIPLFYNFIQWVFAHKETQKAWRALLSDHENKIILDVGCGPGKDSILFLNSKKYIGIDTSKLCISSAQKNYSNNGDFYCLQVEKIESLSIKNIDIVILKNVFHHLSNSVIDKFLTEIKKKMSANGAIYSTDPYLTNRKSITNLVVSLDRGKFLRSAEGLKDVISNQMSIKSEQTIKQKFPPYQRILLKMEI